MIYPYSEKDPQLAPSWKRVVAQIIDLALVWVFAFALLMIFQYPYFMQKWTVFFVYMTYSILFDYFQQATVGKHILKLKILSTAGGKSSLLNMFYRNFAKLIVMSLLVDSLLMLLVPYRQGFHNRITRHRVVNAAI